MTDNLPVGQVEDRRLQRASDSRKRTIVAYRHRIDIIWLAGKNLIESDCSTPEVDRLELAERNLKRGSIPVANCRRDHDGVACWAASRNVRPYPQLELGDCSRAPARRVELQLIGRAARRGADHVEDAEPGAVVSPGETSRFRQIGV